MTVKILVLLAFLSISYSTFIKVNTETHGFVDQYNREVYFHGVNAVYKIAPWHPSTSGFDANNSLSDVDAQNLRSWGFNVVRLGVMWPGVEPSKGNYDSTYLDEIETIVKNLHNENICVILDFHQDLFHRKFCGEGVPNYVYDTCVAAESKLTKPFPAPVVNETYPLDVNGDPDIDSCLSKGFASYYFSQEVSKAFQCLYDNVDGLWDSLANYWKQIAQRFHSYDNVLGYELINEPWVGDLYRHPRTLVPGYTEKTYLQPLYQHIHNAIRSIDDEHIIFFEGLTIDYWPSGFSEGPGGSSYNDRQALAYHIYCPINNATLKKEVVCDLAQDEFFAMRRKDADRIGGGMMMTEFGATRDIQSDLYALQRNCRLMDEYRQSWIYWQFKYYQDITTCTPIGESLYNADSSVNEDKIRVLSRSYPQAVAGSEISYEFNPITALFKLSFLPLATLPTAVTASSAQITTAVYINREYNYPHGAIVTVSEGAPIQISCGKLKDKGLIYFKQTDPWASSVEVTVKPCKLNEKSTCTCK
jgi:endoglycosylceramidase